MRRDVLVFLGALILGLGLAWLFVGGGLGGSTVDPVEPDEAGDVGEAGGPASPTAGGVASDEPEGPRAPVLFGRPREERKGRGALVGRVADVETTAGVPNAALLLAGTGFGGEEVAARATSAEDGTFQFADLPAGEDYALHVEPEAQPARTVPAVYVRADGVTNLGTVWLGEAVAFEGRVVDSSDRAVPGADVQVHGGQTSLLEMIGNMAELFSTLDRDAEPLARTLSDGDGNFAFASLDPGSVTVAVRAPGFELALLQTVVTPAGESTRPLVVRLVEGSTVAGRVVDAAGRGLAGARVASVPGEGPVEFLYGRAFSDTGPDGSFEVDVPAGAEDVMLLATAAGYPLTFHKAAPGDPNVRIELHRGVAVTMRFLVDPDGTPLEGAHVMCAVGEGATPGDQDGTAMATGTTDRAGTFSFDTRPGVVQMVWVTHPEHPMSMWMGAMRGMAGTMKGPEDATLKAGRRELVFRLQRGIRVFGRVSAEGGAPVVGARVMPFAGFQMGSRVMTDADGRYEIRMSGAGATGGFAAVAVQAAGYVQDQTTWAVQVPEGQAEVEHDIELSRAGVVSGRVLDEAGLPVVGATVRIGGGGGLPGMQMFQPVEGISGRNGRFVLDGVTPGDSVRVVARHVDFVDGASEPFEVTGGGSVSGKNVRLGKGAVLEVRVLDPNGGALADAVVELAFEPEDEIEWDFFESFRGDATLRSDRSGSARRERVPAGKVTLTATHAEFASGKATVTVPKDAAAPVAAEVRVRRAVVVEGFVRDAEGAPVQAATVVAMSMSAGDGSVGVPVTGRTDARGAFRLERLPEGPVDLGVSAAGFEQGQKRATAPAADVEIRLRRVDPDREARKQAIQMRMAELGMKLRDAANDAERQAMTQEIQALSQELADLNRGDGAGDE